MPQKKNCKICGDRHFSHTGSKCNKLKVIESDSGSNSSEVLWPSAGNMKELDSSQ